uniref:Uncharacterized protein n=1 Tax=Leersia perrieri TaxID=77586 RepID=A0A0D9VAS0_9ORYZ
MMGIVSDADLYINVHFIGKRNPTLLRPPSTETTLSSHSPIDVLAALVSSWHNGVRVQLAVVFDIMANVVPITEHDSRIHNNGITKEDSLAHLDIGLKFYDLTIRICIAQTTSISLVSVQACRLWGSTIMSYVISMVTGMAS